MSYTLPWKKKPNENGGYISAMDAYKTTQPDVMLNISKQNEKYATPTATAAPDYAKMSQEYMKQYLDRKPFEYDVNSDILYQQYKRQSAESGRLAMEDTMARAAAMTGGYASSYAMTAGQQAYQKQLDTADQMIPELYQLALSRYDAEGSDLLNKASAAASMIPSETTAETNPMSVTDAMTFLGAMGITKESDPKTYQSALAMLVKGGVSDELAFALEFGDEPSGQSKTPIRDALRSAISTGDYTQFVNEYSGGWNWGNPFAGGGIDEDAQISFNGKTYTASELVDALKEEGLSEDAAIEQVRKLQKALEQIN